MSKHTPGPWVAERVFGRGQEITAQGGERRIAAVFDGGLPEDGVSEIDRAVANARLIASAPELLRRVRDRIAACDCLAGIDQGEMGGDEFWDQHACADCLNDAAAIAAATGEDK